MGLDENPEQVVIRHALARGHVTDEQVRRATRAADELRRTGRPASVLALLRRDALRPEHLAELTALWQATLAAAEAPTVAASGGPSGAEALAPTAIEAPGDDVPTLRPALAPRAPVAATGAPPGALGEDERARAVVALREALARHPDFDPLSEVRLERLGELGRGGMGVVYRVRDPALGREAALKLVLPGPDHAAAADAVCRFVREVRITARLEHPSIPPVYVAGTTSRGEQYLLMKLIQGQPLALRLREHDWSRPIDEAERRWLHAQLEVLVRIGEAVAYAHERRVVHRDLKPQNVMVGQFGEVLVMDWGLAKDLTQGDDADEVLRRTATTAADTDAPPDLTQAGTTLGTPGYMSPEQADGQPVDERADVFALGAILVEVLTGAPPIEAVGGLVQRLYATLQGKVVLPRQRRPGLPRELDAIARAALTKERAERTPSADAFVRDLRAYLAGDRVSVHRYSLGEQAVRWVRRHPTALVGALAVVALAAIAGGLAARARRVAERAQEQARAERVRDARDAAEDALRKLAAGRALAPALKALGLAQQWREAAQDAASLAAVQSAAQALGEVALETAQWDLAREALSIAQVEDAEEQVERARGVETARRKAEVQARLERVRTRSDPHLEDAPHDLSRYREGAIVELLAGALDEVSLKLERAAADGREPALDPADRDLARVSCGALGRIGIAERAVEALARCLRAEPDQVRAAEPALALCRLGTGEALELVHAALRHHGGNGPFALLVRRELFRHAARAEPSPVEVREPGARAILRAEEGDLAGAIADFSAALAAAPLDPRLHHDRGRARLMNHDVGGAASDCDRALELDREFVDAYVTRGVARSMLGDRAGAIQDQTRAIELDPGHALAHLNRGETRRELGEHAAALADLDRAIALEPGLARAYRVRSRTRNDAGDHRGAHQDADRALALDANDAAAYASRATARLQLGDRQGALEDCDRALVLDPQLGVAYAARGRARGLLGDHRGSVADYTEALARFPRQAGLLMNRAIGRGALGDLAGAIADLERCLELMPGDVSARALRAQEPAIRAEIERLQGLLRARGAQ